MPAALLPWVKPQFTDAEGHPVAGGQLYSFIAGTTTPQPTYTDVDLAPAHAHPNPIVLNAAGMAASPIYLLPTGYKFRLDDAADVPLWTVDAVEDVGAVFAGGFGTSLAAGGKDVTSGYTVLATDRLVTVASTGGANPCVVNLLPCADASQPLAIKNTGTIPVSVVPNGSDSLEGASAAFSVPAASGTTRPTIWLVSDGVSAYYIIASHGL
jgi:hypothetical protein